MKDNPISSFRSLKIYTRTLPVSLNLEIFTITTRKYPKRGYQIRLIEDVEDVPLYLLILVIRPSEF